MTTATSKTARLLFVDDEQRVLTSMRAMFRRDYEVLLADSGARALEILREEDVDVIVSDQRMPGMTGVEVLREAREIAPEAMRILLTGYADLAAIESAINESEVFRYLMKPCPREELREAVALAVDAVRARERSAVAHDGPTGGLAATQELPAVSPGAAPPEPGASTPTPQPSQVELLVLSEDNALLEGISDAVGEQYRVHHVLGVEEAVECLATHPVGVLVTDAAVDEQHVQALTSELKRHVPELVTIVASERQDAQMLIDLINRGQVFRFLLKPLSIGQSRIWLASAVNRHLELVSDPTATRRYRVAVGEDDDDQAGRMSAIVERARRIRDRLLGGRSERA